LIEAIELGGNIDAQAYQQDHKGAIAQREPFEDGQFHGDWV
jgi:hypothetical protein